MLTVSVYENVHFARKSGHFSHTFDSLKENVSHRTTQVGTSDTHLLCFYERCTDTNSRYKENTKGIIIVIIKRP